VTPSPNASPRLAATYSIVARDPETGELGVAVQSHYFAVGASVSWAEAGVGAIATQAFGNPAFGPLGLAQLRDGAKADDTLRQLLSDDEGRELRQVAIVDYGGSVAVHTGKACVAASGHHTGDGYAVQGNMLRSDGTWEKMAHAFESAAGELAARMLVALEAAESAGGDVRGRQSAALRVVSGRRSPEPWNETRFDVRVDDHADPLSELGRLLDIQRANHLLDTAMEASQQGNPEQALAALDAARGLRPGDPQLAFWTGIVHIRAGHYDAALESLGTAYAADPGWRELLRRLVPLGLVPNDPELLERLAGVGVR
jgi:uncharacterized Ntn-hydrolase superfamily protein